MKRILLVLLPFLAGLAGLAIADPAVYMPGDPARPAFGFLHHLRVNSYINASCTPGSAGCPNTIAGSGYLIKGKVATPFYLGGLTLSNDGTSPNTVFDVDGGMAASDDSLSMMLVRASTTKTLSSWALGTGNGCLDTGSVAQATWYYVYLIQRVDVDFTTDFLCSTSTTPTFPQFYTKKRLIGWIFTCDAVVCASASTNIAQFVNNAGDWFWATKSALDVNTATLGTTAALQTLTHVPPGMKVHPICDYTISNVGQAVLLTSPDSPDELPTAAAPITAVPGFSQYDVNLTNGDINSTCPYLSTNVTQQIRARATAASTTLSIVVRGWRT